MARKCTITPKRGDIFIVNFDPTIGSEIKKTRPALVLQNNIGNKHSSVTIVAAITSHDPNEKLYPTEVFIEAKEGGLDNDSAILLGQIRTVDKQRLINKLGSVSTAKMLEVNKALDISLGMIEI